MKPVASERKGRFASRVEGFLGWRALSAGLTWGARSYVGGSAATPTQCGLIAMGMMPTDRIPHLDQTVTGLAIGRKSKPFRLFP